MDIVLRKGDKDKEGILEIIDEDGLVFLVKSLSRGAEGVRTIRKKLLQEFIDYFEKHPEASPVDAKNELSGKSDIDKYEYGYNASLKKLAVFNIELAKTRQKKTKISLQRIIYGAPGTGKSHFIKEETDKVNCIRTTFHPDSDYSTFVGAYKPTMKKKETTLVNGTTIEEEQISYSFVQQAFTKAYIAAWQNYPKPQYLVIEEINRGNCAQIFGDLFQLLDRNDAGFSEYAIVADDDLKQELSKCFDKGNKPDIASNYPNVFSGEELMLPNNLYIWATMNTSDQSLFPIDSAFKRRWEWKYVPISNANKGYYINIKGQKYDWWSFLEKINEIIEDTTTSEDKKMGYFFAKAATNGCISAEKFVGKVLFFLWNDVFKDYGFNNDVFKGSDGKEIKFQQFFQADGEPNEDTVETFLANLKVDKLGTPTVQEETVTETEEAAAAPEA